MASVVRLLTALLLCVRFNRPARRYCRRCASRSAGHTFQGCRIVAHLSLPAQETRRCRSPARCRSLAASAPAAAGQGVAVRHTCPHHGAARGWQDQSHPTPRAAPTRLQREVIAAQHAEAARSWSADRLGFSGGTERARGGGLVATRTAAARRLGASALRFHLHRRRPAAVWCREFLGAGAQTSWLHFHLLLRVHCHGVADAQRSCSARQGKHLYFCRRSMCAQALRPLASDWLSCVCVCFAHLRLAGRISVSALRKRTT